MQQSGRVQRPNWKRVILTGFAVGAYIPVFWGVAAMVLFNVPEGTFAQLFWNAIYLTCPFWVIEGYKSWLLTPLLNGFLYACLAVLLVRTLRLAKR